MMFTAGIGGSLIAWGIAEPIHYVQTPPFGIQPHSSSAMEWAHMYPLFHWGITPWAFYAIPSVPVAYMLFVKQAPMMKISVTCEGALPTRGRKPLGKLIDVVIALGIIGGTSTSLGLGVPLVSAMVFELFGIPDVLMTKLVVLALWLVLFGASAYRGLKKGIKILADINMVIAAITLLFILLAGPTLFILSISVNSIGLLADNFVRMMTWMDPIEKSGFPEAWTIFYWAWWIAFAPFVALFVGRISRGRTIRQRIMHCPRGKVLGGSSSINGMVYIRGNALDYDRWACEDVSLTQWDYRHCLPYFMKSETREGGGDTYRGDSGPQKVTRGRADNPLIAAFIEAAHQAGYPKTTDMNGYQQEGFGLMDRTTSNGVRHSTAVGYLHPIMGRQNLTILTRACARRLILEGTRVIGLEITHKKLPGKVFANQEVILSGGPLNSPKLLMLSGIGPADHLKEMSIKVVHPLPGVGQNLQDHLEIYLQMECLQPVSLYRYYNPFGKAYVGARWLLTRTGHGASNHFEAGGFIRSRAGVPHPDLQYHFFSMAIRYDGQNPRKMHGFQAHVGPLRSASRGWLKLRSTNPDDAPRICFNYMSHRSDWEEFRGAVRLTREIFNQPALSPYRGRELSPGLEIQSDEEIDDYLRDAVESAFHPSSTCKMGSDGASVVDGRCQVIGLIGLRVVDSSIMPSIVSGNLNAPTIMLAEKAADIIIGKSALKPLDVPVYTAAPK